MSRDESDDHENNLVTAGALYALLSGSIGERLTAVEVVTNEVGGPTNQLDIRLSFMASSYRITVERAGALEDPS